MLQRGRVTSFTATDDGEVKRIPTVTKGAVINDECIFLNLPVTHTVVVEEESTFWAITKKKLAQMEEKHPKLALAITHHILRYASSVRQRLERDINGLEHVTKAQKKESKGGKEGRRRKKQGREGNDRNKGQLRMKGKADLKEQGDML